MKLKRPSKNNKNIRSKVDTKSDEFEFFIILNNFLEQFKFFILFINLFNQIEITIKKIKDKVIYEILEINSKPNEYRRTLKRSKQ